MPNIHDRWREEGLKFGVVTITIDPDAKDVMVRPDVTGLRLKNFRLKSVEEIEGAIGAHIGAFPQTQLNRDMVAALRFAAQTLKDKK